MTNECLSLATKPMIQESQNGFRSYLAYWCLQLDDNGHCYISDTEDMKSKDITMYNFLKCRGVKAKYGILLRNKDNLAIGYIGLEYIHSDVVDLNIIDNNLKLKKIELEILLYLSN